LKKECDLLKKQLDTSVMFKEWSDKVLSKCKTTSDRLFCVEKQQRDGKVICRLRVNYSPDSIRIAKEVCFIVLTLYLFLIFLFLGS
jgi:hypothetical protein